MAKMRFEQLNSDPTYNPLGLDDEFNDASVSEDWELLHGGSSTLTVLEGNPFTVDGKGTDGVLSVMCSGVGSANYRWEGLFKSLGANSFPLYAETCYKSESGSASGFPMCGLAFTDGVSYGVSDMVISSSYIQTNLIESDYKRMFNNSTTFVTEQFQFNNRNKSQWNFVRLVWVAADTFKHYGSIDGLHWTDYGYGDWSNTFTPTHVGLIQNPYNVPSTLDQITTFGYFRVRSGLPA